MKNKGFTLVELLAVIVIISLLSGLAIIGFKSFYSSAEDRYFDALESNILLAGNDYFEDHRGELPVGNDYSEVSLASLIDAKYMEPITDTNGNECREGSVFAYRVNNKFKYETCIVNCGGYSSTGRYCTSVASREIVVSAKTKRENSNYDVTKSFNATEYTKNDNIIVTLNMSNDYNVSRYVLTNTKNNNEIVCNQMNENACSTEISTTGTYKIVAYDDDMEISSRYINAKIARNGSNFTLRTSDGKTRYLISNATCSNVVPTTKVIIDIVKGNAKEEYKTVEYKINDGEYEETNRLRIEKELPSGHYEIEVVVTNYNDDVSIETISFDVSYLINLSYDDNTTATHEVVKGQNYNYLSNLPTTKNINGQNLEVSWYNNTTLVSPTNIVTSDCTYTLNGVTVVSYAITYNLNGGTATNPTSYNERTETFTLANPTKSGSTFMGWTGSNDISTGLSGYTTTNPYVAGARDNYFGNEFTVTSGNTYRIFLTAKKTAGTLKMQGGIWYTAQTAGSAWDGYGTDFIEIDSLGNGWARYYKDVTVPAGKTKGKVYVQLQQWPEALATTWQIADVHVVPATSTPTITISKGSTGDRVYNAYWKASHTLTLNLNGGSYSGSTTLTNPSGTVFSVPHTPTKGGYTFNGWTLSGGGWYEVYDTASTATETRTFNFNSASSALPYTYNNSNNGTVSLQMVADSTASGGYALKVTTNGTASPGTGGFWLNVFPLTPGRINVLAVTAKIPTGYKLLDGGNGTLYHGYGSYIDDTQNVMASGRWLTYYLYYYTGNTGEITENIYMHLSGSNNTSVTWYVNSIVVKSYTKEQFKSKYTFGGSNATLTANWRTSGSGVTFNTNGGTFNTTYVKSWNNGYYNASASSALRHYSYNESVATHPGSSNYNWVPDNRVISRTGYIFDGWYTAASGGTKVFNVDGTLVPSVSGYSDSSKRWIKYDSNVTLYAKWTPNALTFNNQSISKSFSTGAQTFSVTGASNGTGAYTYTIKSQPSGSYFTISGTTVTIKASAPAGTHSVVITAKDSNSNVTKDATYTVTVAKVNATCPTISDWTGTYDGSQHSINVSGGSGGSIQYRWNSTTEAWRDTKPTASIAGTWKVYVQMKGDSNHNTVSCGYKTLTINKANPSFAKTESSKSIYNGRSETYGLVPSIAGKITSSSNATGVATVSQASNCSSIGAGAQCVITITGKSVGSATITHTFTPNDSNYNSVTTTMPVTIKSSTFTVTFAGVNPISTSFDNQTVTLAGNVGVPAYASSTLALAANTNYVVSFDYKCASGSNQFDVDFFPDTLPQTNPTATTTLQHMDWVTSSSNSAMGSAQLRFFDDFQGSGETDITITNIMLSRTSTKSVNYGSTYGELPAPTRSGYTFLGWYTASNGGTLITSSSTVSTTANHTLYARWQKNTPSCFPWTQSCYCGNSQHGYQETHYYQTESQCNSNKLAGCNCSCSKRSC